MNKKSKRQLNIRNKLIGAIAMLLVSSIMMVSTTYAWFTLSTAPEVQGITTTVGANGNLEIALSPESGDYDKISSGVGDANNDWTVKNLTWGNLLDLSDEGYSLSEITLLPARLDITAGTQTSPATLNTSPLKIPAYGADGRISELVKNKVIFGAKDSSGNVSGFIQNSSYGVRAMGTSSSMSPEKLNFQSALSNLESSRVSAKNTVTDALNLYGAALADIAIIHAGEADTTETEYYDDYVDDLAGITAELVEACAIVEEGLYNALMAMTLSDITISTATDGTTTTITKITDLKIAVEKTDDSGTYTTNVSLYEYLKMNQDTLTVDQVWDTMVEKVTEDVLNENFPALVESYNTWLKTSVAVASTADEVKTLVELDTDGDNIEWKHVSTALSGLMNADSVTINGKTIDEAKQNPTSLLSGNGINLQLAKGSGVIANFGELTGNISSTVTLGEVSLKGTSLTGTSINLVTTSEPAAGALMTQVRAVINSTGVHESSTSTTTAIDVTYGYALDFVFRTNAANSNLLLQTEAAQRIYEDGNNAATMGNGSTISFNGTYGNLDSLISMMSGIRVVFTNTKGETQEVYGIAKVVFDNTAVSMSVIPLERTAVAHTEGEGDDATTTYTLGYNDQTAQVMDLYVSTSEVGSNLYVSTDMGDGTHIFKETVTDATTNESYEIWTVKTAKWYDVTTETYTYDGENWQLVSSVTVRDEAYEEVTNADGKTVKKTLFFEGDTTFSEEAGLVTDASNVDNKYPDYVEKLEKTTYSGSATAPVLNDTMSVVSVKTALDYVEGDNYSCYYPQYYKVYDQDLAVEGELYLHNYEVAPEKINDAANPNAGMLTFGDVMDVQTLTTLDQNVPTGVTALVYLDGDYVDNSDVTNSSNGISNTGMLNLQFASSATLVPMTNTELKNGAEYKATFDIPEGVKVYKISGLSAGEIDTTETITVNNGVDYTFVMVDNSNTVTYKAGTEGSTTTLTGEATEVSVNGQTATVYVYTVPGQYITGDLTITISEKTSTDAGDGT